jgi:hypothetical protein
MKYDVCVLCGKDSPYLQDVNVEFRIGYIEGAGQLCSLCYLSGKGEKNYFLVDEDIFKNTPNDSELGYKIRKIYNDRKSNS